MCSQMASTSLISLRWRVRLVVCNLLIKKRKKLPMWRIIADFARSTLDFVSEFIIFQEFIFEF